MKIEGFDESECDVILNCLQVMFKVEQIMNNDFHTVHGFSREELFNLIENWDTANIEDDEVVRKIGSTLSSLSGYPHVRDWDVFCYTGKYISEIEIVGNKFFKKFYQLDQKSERVFRTQELVCQLRTIEQYRTPDELARLYSRGTDRKLGTLLCYFDLSTAHSFYLLSIFSFGIKLNIKNTETSVAYHDISSVALRGGNTEKYYLLVEVQSETFTIGKDNSIIDDIGIFRLKRFFDKVDKVKSRKRQYRNFI